MNRKFKSHAASSCNAFADTLGQLEMMAVARGQVGACLGNTDNRFAAHQFFACKAEIEVAFDIKSGHSGIVGVIEP